MKNHQRVGWLFLLPSLVAVSIFVLIPFAQVVYRSFFSALGGNFVGFQNYSLVLNNAAFQLAAWNTVKFTAICLPLLLVLSLTLAVMVNALKEKRGIFKTTFLIPMSIPVASIVLLWRVIFHDQGLANRILLMLDMAPVSWMGSGAAFGLLVFTYVWKNVGYNMVLWISGITGISPSLHEAAALDGAGAFRRFRYITLPNLRSTLFSTAVLSLLNSFKVFREAYMLGGAYPHRSMYMLQHTFNNWFLHLEVDKMYAGAVLMALAVLLLIGVLKKGWGDRI